MARYELVERIGVGGMAEIFRGKATAGGGFEKPVAIKKILPHLSSDKRFVELLITEAKTLSQLRHRNIVQIYDVGLGDDGQYFLVMEFVDGLDLGHLYEALEKRNKRLPIGVALHGMAEVCEALDHAHRARGHHGEPLGLVHRDVSPSNVLLSRSGEVKLTDFGIAKRTEEVTGHGGVRGKFAYISPEQAHNRHVDGRSDVYSVGIVLFEMVTGKRLFSQLPDFDALKAVRESRTPRPRDVLPSIDDELERILMTALAPRPDDRFGTAGQFGAALRKYRYSMTATSADPQVEIGRLLEEYAGPGAGNATGRPPTFIRINTVAGFTGGFELSEESTGGGIVTEGITGEISAPARDELEDEETRAVRLKTARSASDPPIDELATRVADPNGLPAPVPRSGDFDLSDAETSVHDFRRARGFFGRALPAGLFGRPGSDLATPRRGVASVSGLAAAPVGLAPAVESSGFEPGRDDAGPAIRQALFGERYDARPPAPSIMSGPIPQVRATPRRRRALLLAGVAVVLLAAVGFALAGVLREGGADSAAADSPDAGPIMPDASLPTMTMPPENVDPPRERPRRKKKKKTTSTKKKSDRKKGDRR